MVAQPAHTKHVLKPLTFKPLMPETPPLKPFSWPPKGFQQAFKVSGGYWDWGKVATHFIIDVKDLIYFNFETTRPREVNWFLRNYIGCYKSKDGMNFDFEGAEPGVIYIPSPGWKREFGTVDTLEVRFFGRLSYLSVYYKHIVHHRGMSIHPIVLREFLNRGLRGLFDIELDPSLDTPAAYWPREDVIYVKDTNLSGFFEGAMILHESLHACFQREVWRRTRDRAKLPHVRGLDNEFIAYVGSWVAMWDVDSQRTRQLFQRQRSIHQAAMILAYLIHKDGDEPVFISGYDKTISNPIPEMALETRRPIYPRLTSPIINPVDLLESEIRQDPRYKKWVNDPVHWWSPRHRR